MTIIADPPPHPDQALVAAAAADSAAFVYLYTKYVDKIYQFIYYRTGQNPEVAQDLTAEVFARGLQHIDRFEWQGYPYSAYLYQIARGLCQRSYNQPVLVEIDDGVPSPVSGQVIAVQADQRLLWQRIAQLPPELQELFVLRFKDDLSYDDIAVIVQKSSGAIRTAISRGIKQLKTLYHYDT